MEGLNIALKYDIGSLLRATYNGQSYEGLVYDIKVLITQEGIKVIYSCIKSSGKTFKHVIIYKRKEQ